MLQMRRWGGNSSRSAAWFTRKQTGAHYLIESRGLDLDTAGDWVLIVKLQCLETGGCAHTEKKSPETGMGGTMIPGKVEMRTPQISITRLF